MGHDPLIDPPALCIEMLLFVSEQASTGLVESRIEDSLELLGNL
jgi:hypothetical protein